MQFNFRLEIISWNPLIVKPMRHRTVSAALVPKSVPRSSFMKSISRATLHTQPGEKITETEENVAKEKSSEPDSGIDPAPVERPASPDDGSRTDGA
ncbi:hypothetical protein AVEN_41230-1 [Araneus ventricosus]|uniref:Uncharacterized protein n=1 Tax=Araneus ventricosus TaxID=182803 RepID=A0A4Y2SJ44_ARAVE|nr:hypothetical protein AVEN_41230-1 [Araneus ventricosus]